jgi:hypothetical protein
MRSSLVIAIALSGALCSSSAPAQVFPRPFHPAVGCWLLEVPDSLNDQIRRLVGTGVRIELTPEVQQWRGPYFSNSTGARVFAVWLWARAKAPKGLTQLYAYWAPMGYKSDTLTIVWGRGVSEIEATMELRGDSLLGAGRWHFEGGASAPFAVVGKRRRC